MVLIENWVKSKEPGREEERQEKESV